jgi:FAD dependent oxidoreductase TIGR03364
VPAFAEYLRSLGVRFHFSTAAVGADTGVLRTSRGDLAADYVALTLGHELDQLLPEPSDAAGLRRCQLHMLRVAAPAGFRLAPAVLTGTSLLRYDGFLACPSSTALRQELEAEAPALIAAGVNLMFVQHPSGDLIVGDSHVYDATPAPFADEELDALLLHEAGRLLGVAGFTVKERWLGTYASTPSGAYLTPRPAPGVVGAAVTSGIGMTTALGLAPSVLDALIASSDASVH